MDRRPSVPSRARLLFATVLVATLALGAAACGDDDDAKTGDQGSSATASGSDDPYGSTSGGDAGGEAGDGTIVAKDFSLTDITVSPGQQIVLKNEGGTKHTATADEGDAFDLEAAGGETSDPGTAPEEPGTYTFHCEIHSSMTATLTVEA